MVANKENKIKEMSDAEFLSFLYSERDREEKISIFQGWNIWAILGAIITIVLLVLKIKKFRNKI